ncbi:endonuclease NucS domain-containing protein [Maricaulis sp.]|uniref:endonuclease NucS domain-containing protein n=1 Tax=Maricaulis sp. TaxID=1486257 RepID=UPI003A925047
MSGSPSYYRVMSGQKSVYSDEGRRGGWIGGGWKFDFDLDRHLTDDWRDFNTAMKPIFLKNNPDKSKVAAGLACGMLWTICKGISDGDIILTPDGAGAYHVGKAVGRYFYHEGHDLPHRRRVEWLDMKVDRSAMSEGLRNSTGSVGTVSNITKHGDEVERLIRGEDRPTIISTDDTVEDPGVFALEQHLEHFLVMNWQQTELGRHYDIFEEDGELVGQQFPTDTGPIDILAISKDRRELLVVELKKGRASDAVVGQIQRYMGYVLDELTSDNQTVRGAIIALHDDIRLKRALRVTSNIDFYRYQVSFRLTKDERQ